MGMTGGRLAETTSRTSMWVLVVVGVFLLCYARVIVELMNQWAGNPIFSFGFAVPLISGYPAKLRLKPPSVRDERGCSV
jgi:hypothetical protein